MALPDLSGGKNYVDGLVLTEQDLDDLFLDELNAKYFTQNTVTLADNTSSVADVFTLTASTNTIVAIEYSRQEIYRCWVYPWLCFHLPPQY